MSIQRLFVLVLALAACGGTDEPTCGNAVCDGSESAESCAADCGCGNGIADPGEACDGADLAGATCLSAAQHGGTLGCTAECTLDVTGCTLPACGNAVVEDGEICDGADLGGRTCNTIGYAGGTLGCKPACAYDVTGCCADTCPADGLSECVGDTLRLCAPAATGCLQWQVMDCDATNGICETNEGAAACTCIDRCVAGDRRCEGATIETCGDVGGCLDWMQTTNCGADSGICATAPTGPLCAPDVTAEDCADPYPLVPGENVVAWTAINADYLTDVSCDSTALTGPDLVLAYTASEDGFIRFTMTKPASARQVFVVSAQACGTVQPELDCVVDSVPTALASELSVAMGTTYHFYVRDTTTNTAPLDNPMFVSLEETRCSAMTNTVTTLVPANGASVPDQTPVLTARLEYPIDPGAGVITVTGNLGTNLTYDLLTAPDEIAIVDDGKTLVIDPGIVFPPNEIVTVAWSGLHDAACGLPIAAPVWTFEISGPACAPGVNGMIGNSITRVPTGLASLTEQYVAADANPNGFVYFGGTTALHRIRKTGGTTENVTTAAGLVAANLGYDMVILGDQIYTLDESSTVADRLWRITTDGGATWNKQSYLGFSTPPTDLRGITHHDGRFYLTTQDTVGTQIWSVAAGSATTPQQGVLEATVADEDNCSGVAVDDDYFYLACSNDSRLLRVDRVTQAREVLSSGVLDLSTTKNVVHAHDLDGDGRADVLYVQSDNEEVSYICAPNAGTAPFFVDVLASFGSGTSNFGLGFDPANGALWMFDDDSRELVKIE